MKSLLCCNVSENLPSSPTVHIYFSRFILFLPELSQMYREVKKITPYSTLVASIWEVNRIWIFSSSKMALLLILLLEHRFVSFNTHITKPTFGGIHVSCHHFRTINYRHGRPHKLKLDNSNFKYLYVWSR